MFIADYLWSLRTDELIGRGNRYNLAWSANLV